MNKNKTTASNDQERFLRFRTRFFLALVFVLTVCRVASAAAPGISLTPQDKILIFAPHPDDETIGTAGIIQKAMAMGIPLKVVYLTYGDNNELAFFVYKKRPILTRGGLLGMGELRHQEAIAAMKFLGLKEHQLIFLGYPDFGTTEIFTKYWGETRPFKSMLTRVTKVPYKDAFFYHEDYKGESILHDIKKILLDFRPTKVFVTLPADTNVDHRAYYLFLQIALWDLEGKIPDPEVYPYIVHIAGWPLPRGFSPELPLDIPERLSQAGLNWWVVPLDPGEVQNKKNAIAYYKSQNAYNPRYLFSFARKNELFGRFHDVLLKENEKDIDWDQNNTRQRIISHIVDEKQPKRNIIQSVNYAQQRGKLFIRLSVNNWESKLSGINLYLIGYKNSEPFPKMPKIRININFDRFVSVYDKLKQVDVNDMTFSHDPAVLLIEFPLSDLGDPDRILTCARSYVAELPLDATPWRTLIVDSIRSHGHARGIDAVLARGSGHGQVATRRVVP